MSENSKITITPIIDASPLQLCCPACGEVALVVGAHEAHTPDGGYFLHGGDNLDIGPGLSPAQASGFYTSIHGGRCEACGEAYAAHGVKFFDVNASRSFFEGYVLENVPMDVTHFECRRLDETWLMTRYETPEGPMVGHLFGPHPQDDVDVEAAAREAWADLLRLWDDLPRPEAEAA